MTLKFRMQVFKNFTSIYIHAFIQVIYVEHPLFVLGSMLDNEDALVTKSDLASLFIKLK